MFVLQHKTESFGEGRRGRKGTEEREESEPEGKCTLLDTRHGILGYNCPAEAKEDESEGSK